MAAQLFLGSEGEHCAESPQRYVEPTGRGARRCLWEPVDDIDNTTYTSSYPEKTSSPSHVTPHAHYKCLMTANRKTGAL